MSQSVRPVLLYVLIALSLSLSLTPSPAIAQESSGNSDISDDWRTAAIADDDGPAWKEAVADSVRLLGLQHMARVALQGKTRRELGGPFFRDYQQSLRTPSRWNDGDGWLMNYVGHPIQGAASGFIWVANDPKSRGEQFGLKRDYWTTRWRALAWSAGYSLQFEIGPLSEASIGNVGLDPATVGWTDHVVTPIGGTALMIAEDALDRFVVQWVERRTRQPIVRGLTRLVFNPSRSVANVAQGMAPWHRDGRAMRRTLP